MRNLIQYIVAKRIGFYCIIILVNNFTFSCSNKKEPNLGKYVYVDGQSTVHIDKDCHSIAKFRDAYPVTVYSTNVLIEEDWQSICPECVSDESYEMLLERSRVNESRKSLYNTLSQKYDMGSFEKFSSDIENDVLRLKLYNSIKDEYNIPDYYSFSRTLLLREEEPKENGNVGYIIVLALLLFMVVCVIVYKNCNKPTQHRMVKKLKLFYKHEENKQLWLDAMKIVNDVFDDVLKMLEKDRVLEKKDVKRILEFAECDLFSDYIKNEVVESISSFMKYEDNAHFKSKYFFYLHRLRDKLIIYKDNNLWHLSQLSCSARVKEFENSNPSEEVKEAFIKMITNEATIIIRQYMHQDKKNR